MTADQVRAERRAIAQYLRAAAEAVDNPPHRRAKVFPANPREREMVKGARAYGLRWAAEFIDEMDGWAGGHADE